MTSDSVTDGPIDERKFRFDELATDALLTTTDTRTGGEPTHIVTDGIDYSMLVGDFARRCHDSFVDTHGWMRDLLMREPRGHDDMFETVVADSGHPDAGVDVFFMGSRGYLGVCGHGTIGAVSALLKLDRFDRYRTTRVETPAGFVGAIFEYVSDESVRCVTIRDIRSFVYDQATAPVSFLDSSLRVDAVYAGSLFTLVGSDQLGLPIEPQYTVMFVDWSLKIRNTVNERLDIVHPPTGEEGSIPITEVYDTPDEMDRSIAILGEGRVDYSPCGTRTCAEMAPPHDADTLDAGESYLHESIVGTHFEGRLVATRERGGVTLTTPLIAGSARVTGKHAFTKDAKNSLSGFSISVE